MISMTNWKIRNASMVGISGSDPIYEYCYVGTELTLDDRLEWINQYATSVAETRITAYYNHEFTEMILSSEPDGISIGNFFSACPPRGRILFDATSLLLPELLYLMEWANHYGKCFDVIYVEPDEYSVSSYKPKIGIQSIDFSLSEDGPGINMLPRFTTRIDESHLVVGLGYEGHRFGSLLISDEITPRSVTGILGVPPFVLGWEKNTYAKNHNEMSEARKRLEADFKVIAANDPIQNYDAIKTIHKSLSAQDQKGRAKLHLAPIGTKPVAVAMSWFAINHRGTGILYDFVKKKVKRSSGMGRVHFWSFLCQ